MMQTIKEIQSLYSSSQCGSKLSLGRCSIHRNHGVVACAMTQKQHQNGSCDYLRADAPFEDKNDCFDAVPKL
jgi:hypothetical protein